MPISCVPKGLQLLRGQLGIRWPVFRPLLGLARDVLLRALLLHPLERDDPAYRKPEVVNTFRLHSYIRETLPRDQAQEQCNTDTIKVLRSWVDERIKRDSSMDARDDAVIRILDELIAGLQPSTFAPTAGSTGTTTASAGPSRLPPTPSSGRCGHKEVHQGRGPAHHGRELLALRPLDDPAERHQQVGSLGAVLPRGEDQPLPDREGSHRRSRAARGLDSSASVGIHPSQ